MLEYFFTSPGIAEAMYVNGSYAWPLVALSVLSAVFSSMMALQMSGLAQLAESRLHKQFALLSGSVALGVGIWSMHFIGILAYSFCATASYSKLLTALSMLPGILASWFALNLLSKDDFSKRELLISGTVMGAGIGLMHYSGMAAVHMPYLLRYDSAWFLLSIVVAVCMAMLALWIRFDLKQRGRLSNLRAILIGGSVMGLAISAMHYTGMAAARFVGLRGTEGALNGDENNYLALIIAIVTMVASGLILAGNFLLRLRQLYNRMQENEERLRAIVETALDGIITMDAQGRILAANDAACSMFGWQSGALVGHNIQVLMPESDSGRPRQFLSDFFTSASAKVSGQSREISARRADGSIFPIRLAVGRASTVQQQFFVGFVTDISERITMQTELQERETKYRTLIANIPGVAFRSRVDAQWTKIFISDAVLALTGWDRAAFMEQQVSYADLIHPNDIAHVRKAVADALSEHTSYSIEYRLFRKDGSERWLSESAGGVYGEDGKALWIDGVMLDITESKIQAAEYQGIVMAIRKSLAVAEFDMQGNILDVNENFEKLTGYRLEELRGKNHRMLCTAEEAASQEYVAFWRKLRDGRFHSGEFYREGKNGKKVWLQAAYNPILDIDGKPWKVVKLAADLAQRKAIELDLISAKDIAEQASAAKGMFLANMSHEIRTPMNAIIGFTEILLKTQLDQKQLSYLKTVKQSARSLLGLLNDILDTAKLERGAIELEKRDFSLHDLCEQLISTFRIQADSKHIRLEFHYDASCPAYIRSDELRLRQILTNILGNAVKFTEQGEVKLTVSAARKQLHFVIEDTGIGISADRIDSIFAPFTQADASMSRRFGGTGLGTTIAKQLTDLMDGEIGVSSVPGQGSRFEVVIPLEEGNPAGVQKVVQHAEMPPLTILIADDVAENLQLLRLMLEDKGHTVVAASGGQAAVDAFASSQFDVILMDVQMPDIDGLEATRRIIASAAAGGRTTPAVIALTASVLNKDRDAAIEAGMRGFATKPINLPELENEMLRVLGIAQPERAQSSAGAAVQNDEWLDWNGALSRWREPASLIRAIGNFVGNAALLDGLHATAAAADLAAIGHRIKGAAANLGLSRVAVAAAAIEHAAGYDGAALDALAAELAQARTELAKLENNAAPQGGTERVQAGVDVPALLSRLQRAFSHSTFDDEAISQLMPALDAQQASSLQSALDDFDFEQAQREIGRLMQAYPAAAGS
ncbi:PAS domain S-box protein [Duganella qianjiadongensis]|uniref:histidine kinase n=1 Tax=Duganella qianjiadongensis TaxID=2692176 RepID=A0ABW9VIN0_9BURK|nr:PAS domain S-box protein [Duganella qianjiadongensis]MYM39463.1 PAS domain S-box protein [Duganella qianjiadongensis]